MPPQPACIAAGLQGVTTLGTIYSSSLFPGRCPSGEMLLLNYIGGATNRGVAQVGGSLRPLLQLPASSLHACAHGSRCKRSKTVRLRALACTGAPPHAADAHAHCPACLAVAHITQASTEELVAQVDKDLRTMLLKPDAPAPRVVGVRVWPRAIPQFNVGHGDTLDAAKQVRVLRCRQAAGCMRTRMLLARGVH